MPAAVPSLLGTIVSLAPGGYAVPSVLHGAGPDSDAGLPWAFHPSIVIGTALFVTGYLYGIGPLRRRYGWASAVNPWQVASFLLGCVVFFLALVSPLDALSDDYLFSAHMVQHMLLVFLVAPLLLAGTPGWLLRPLLRPRWVHEPVRFLTHPVTAFLLFNGVFLCWHVPPLYEAALENEAIHALQHLMMLATAVINWWPVMSPVAELSLISYPARVLYLFVDAQPNNLLGAGLTLSQVVFYPKYAAAPRLFAISPLTDQQIGGLIMWVPGSVVYLAVLSIMFLRWFGADDQGKPDWPAEKVALPEERPGGDT